MSFSRAETTRLDIGRSVVFLFFIAVFAAPGPASAQTTGSLQDRCARLGEGFVSVAGSNACVRIGGHVRADSFDGRTIESEWGRNGARPVADQRIRAGSAGTGLYPR